MLNKGEMEFYEKIEEQNVSVLPEEAPKSVTIFYLGGGQQATKEAPRLPTPRLVVKIPAPFHYTNDKAVPWNYSSQEVIQELQAAAEQKLEKTVNDIVEMGMTSSGWCYTLINSETKEGRNDS